ncbi:MAG: hypothetical protein ACOC3V_02965 [bacterium]
MEKYIKKIPIHGFISVCMRCKSNKVRIEVREDGVDFQCQKCGNKMLLRPGESFQIQAPKNKINKRTREFEQELNKPLNEDWADQVINDWIEKKRNN